MTTQAQTTEQETAETFAPTSDVITDDGAIITPTQSRTKASLFDHSASWVAASIALIVVFGFGMIVAFGMGMSVEKHEVTKTAYTAAGACAYVESFMIPGNQFGQDPVPFGENPALFDQYQAEYPNEHPTKGACPIVYENNFNH